MIVVSPHWPAKCDWQTPGMTAGPARPARRTCRRPTSASTPTAPPVTGVNAGANGAWKLVADAPDRFSAALPIETNVPPPVPDDQVAACVRAVPGRAYVPAADAATAARLARQSAGSSHAWATVPLPPSAGPLTRMSPYADAALLAWLTAQRRPAPAASAEAK